jgi:hypothetical protein
MLKCQDYTKTVLSSVCPETSLSLFVLKHKEFQTSSVFIIVFVLSRMFLAELGERSE